MFTFWRLIFLLPVHSCHLQCKGMLRTMKNLFSVCWKEVKNPVSSMVSYGSFAYLYPLHCTPHFCLVSFSDLSLFILCPCPWQGGGTWWSLRNPSPSRILLNVLFISRTWQEMSCHWYLSALKSIYHFLTDCVDFSIKKGTDLLTSFKKALSPIVASYSFFKAGT